MGKAGSPALVLAMLAVAISALGAGEAIAAPPKSAASFEWHLPSRYNGATDERGRIVETQPYEVRRGPWRVFLRTTGPACSSGAHLRWRTTGGGHLLHPSRLGPCRFRLRLAREGTYRVRLAGRAGGARLRPTAQRIVVRDRLIVSIGDSVASGEGVPEAPGFFSSAVWQSARCHRSSRAGTARAARQIEADDGHSSVTFVHLACSGAGVREGLLAPYPGAVPPRDEAPLEPQVQVLEGIASRRAVDVVLVGAGPNDLHFSEIASFCAFVASSDCFARPMPPRYGGDGVHSPREAVKANLVALRHAYRRLAHRLSRLTPSPRVYITEYFDPTHDERGVTCDGFFGSIDENEVEQARTRILEPLNRAVAGAANRFGWHLVDGITAAFRNHGYCAGDSAWVSTLGDSLRNLGGIAGRHRGTLHPNGPGQEVIGALIAADLEHELYPKRDFPLRPFPGPVEGEDGGISTGAVVALVLVALLLGPAIVALAVSLAPFLVVLALLWLGRGTVSPFVLGLALGALCLLEWKFTALAARPFVTLAKTARPLLLPLLVAIAVGAASLSLAAQLLLSAALLVIAWKLILVPEANKSLDPREESSEISRDQRRRLAIETVFHGLIAVAVGTIFVFAIRVIALDSPYFETVGNLTSGLLLVAVALWVIAIALRLFSYATNVLRGLAAALIGLALGVLAAGGGVLPGRDIVGDHWPLEAAVLALFALLVMAIDAAVGVHDESEHKPPYDDRPRGTTKAAHFGVGVAAAAAVVLAFSIEVGLIDAAKRGKPLNPPEEEIAAVRTLAPGQVAGADPLELARKYAPVLAFSKGERWAPESVDSYLADAMLTGPRGRREAPAVGHLPRRCPERGRSSCFQVSIECDRGDMTCAGGEFRAPGPLYRDGAVYVRVVKKGALSPGDPPGIFAPEGPYRDRLRTLIQYWYFYRYDEWRAPLFAGLLVQRHEADWEAVTLGLDRDDRPLFVADSAHCAGSWRPWKEVEASTRLPGPRTHPLVAVAEGSHANYPDPEEKRSPDWASCADAPKGVTTAIGYASNIRDKTEFGWLWYPPAGGWLEVGPKTPPMSFPGAWGADDRTTLRNFTTHVLNSGDAPKSPPLQALWQDPIGSIFCGRFEPEECLR